ncbi:Hypothetical protein PBC10988_24260 [Planctomycetales bacterium 10988]|nr:Hypothetical protein PBC10988_24260 [Planctomycetales bacterium 10988]
MPWNFLEDRSVRSAEDTILQLEQLEDRQLLDAEAYLIDINPNGNSSPNHFAELNGTAFFAANFGSLGTELWMSDGTSAGTQLVKDLRSGTASSTPKYLVNFEGTLFFQANGGSEGTELWKSDGTSAGTQLVKDIFAGASSSSPKAFAELNGTLFFEANDGCNGRELWKTDGTSLGTSLVADINAGSGSGIPNGLFNFDGTLFFSANNGSNGTGFELWTSNGTSGGTQLFADLWPGSIGAAPGEFTNVDGTMFFDAYAGSLGRELWISDGTTTGTQLIADIVPGAYGSYPGELTEVNGTLFFVVNANDASNGTELWKSDGTSTGTQIVKDLQAGSASSYASNLVNLNGTLFFTANGGSNGYELWQTDGTSAGTMLADDLIPGSPSSSPRSLANINGTLFFQANSGSQGIELWVLEVTPPTLEITPDGGSTSADPILFTFEFSEDVTGFEAGDIFVTNGTAGTFTTVDANTYTLEVMPTADGDVTVTVADGVAEDLAGNENLGDSATIESDRFDELPRIVTGSDAGSGIVRLFDESGNEVMSFFPYTAAFTGGVRVAAGDINGDGILDIVTAAGPGGGPRVQVFSSDTSPTLSGPLMDFYAYTPSITVGLFVAVGDVNDDGFDDIITAPDLGGGPHVKVFSGQDGSLLSEFYAYNPTFTGGVRIAAGDIDGNGTAEIITAAGPGGGPHIRAFEGTSGMQMPGAATNFYAYAANVTTGVFVAAGDVNDDGLDDIITAPDAGGGPHVKVFSSDDGSLLQNFYAYDPSFVGGVRVGATDLNFDGFADILTVPGPSGGPHARAFSGVDLADLANFYSGLPTNSDGLFITGGLSVEPLAKPASAPFFASTPETGSSPPESLLSQWLQPKKAWTEDLDELYSKAEKIDQLFSGLGIQE